MMQRPFWERPSDPTQEKVDSLRFYSDVDRWTFRCECCGKRHVDQSGKVCPCGEPFPYPHAAAVYRRSA